MTDKEKVAQWMISRGYATGHGDTIEDLLAELDQQLFENWNSSVMKVVAYEREACANVADVALLGAERHLRERVVRAIRARGEK